MSFDLDDEELKATKEMPCNKKKINFEKGKQKMKVEEAIEQLKSLKEHCKIMQDTIFQKDVLAIETILAAYQEEKENWLQLLHFYNQRVNDIIKLENKIEELENGDLTTVYMSGFYYGEKKWKDKIKAKIEEIRQRREKDGECELALHGFQREAKIEVLQLLLKEE